LPTANFERALIPAKTKKAAFQKRLPAILFEKIKEKIRQKKARLKKNIFSYILKLKAKTLESFKAAKKLSNDKKAAGKWQMRFFSQSAVAVKFPFCKKGWRRRQCLR
jgi:hypothetical protein